MPYHTPDARTRNAMKKVKENSIENRIANGNKKKKPMKVFERKPPNSHLMPDGTVMSGSTHSKGSKVLGKMKPKSGSKAGGKGSKAMKEKMAKLRAMRKKK